MFGLLVELTNPTLSTPPSNTKRDSECPYHEALKVALLVPLGDTVSAIMVEPPTQSSTDALDAPSNLTPKPSRASVWMSLTFVAPLSSSNRSSCRDSESLAITYDVMATTRLIVYLNASFAITGNVKDRSFNLAENCNKGQRII